MAAEFRTHKRIITRTLGDLYRARVVAWNNWMSAMPGDTKKTALREYYGVLGSIREVRATLVDLKREMNHAR